MYPIMHYSGREGHPIATVHDHMGVQSYQELFEVDYMGSGSQENASAVYAYTHHNSYS